MDNNEYHHALTKLDMTTFHGRFLYFTRNVPIISITINGEGCYYTDNKYFSRFRNNHLRFDITEQDNHFVITLDDDTIRHRYVINCSPNELGEMLINLADMTAEEIANQYGHQ